MRFAAALGIVLGRLLTSTVIPLAARPGAWKLRRSASEMGDLVEMWRMRRKVQRLTKTLMKRKLLNISYT